MLPRRHLISPVITASRRDVALRIPGHDFVLKLIAKFDRPLVMTSANLSGLSEISSAREIRQCFDGRVWQPDLFIDAGELPKTLPSTIIDLTTESPSIIRQGAVQFAEILKKLQ